MGQLHIPLATHFYINVTAVWLWHIGATEYDHIVGSHFEQRSYLQARTMPRSYERRDKHDYHLQFI